MAARADGLHGTLLLERPGEALGSRKSTYIPQGACAQITNTLHATGHQEHTTWQGFRKVSHIDVDGTETHYTHDPLGRIKTKTQTGVPALGNYPAQADRTTTYTYNALDQITLETHTAGNLTQTQSHHYDQANRLTSSTDPRGLQTTPSAH